MAIPIPVPFLAKTGFSVIGNAIATLYGVVDGLNDFLNHHIETMKASNNATVSRTGRILEMAKYGFGLGYISSVTIIAAGQYLLGNTFAAVATVATAATLSNPIAMTCAAVGAILYGWGALEDGEKNAVLDTLAQGLSMGVELIKSIINFVISTAKEMLDAKGIQELKGYIADKAALFGRTLSDVTHLKMDVLRDSANAVARHVQEALSETARAASGALDATGNAANRALESGKALVQRKSSENPLE